MRIGLNTAQIFYLWRSGSPPVARHHHRVPHPSKNAKHGALDSATKAGFVKSYMGSNYNDRNSPGSPKLLERAKPKRTAQNERVLSGDESTTRGRAGSS